MVAVVAARETSGLAVGPPLASAPLPLAAPASLLRPAAPGDPELARRPADNKAFLPTPKSTRFSAIARCAGVSKLGLRAYTKANVGTVQRSWILVEPMGIVR